MLYAITYTIEGVCGPGGTVDISRESLLGLARSLAETALDQLADVASLQEWFYLEGQEVDPRFLLQSNDNDQITNTIEQISDAMKAHKLGYIDLWEFADIFHLIEDQDVSSWCSLPLKERIVCVRKAYFGLVNEIADEWLDE